jgi:hypothetical protein
MMFKGTTFSNISLRKRFNWTKRKLKLPFGPLISVALTVLILGLRFIIPDAENYPYINYFSLICGMFIMIVSIPTIRLSINSGNGSFIKSSIIFLLYSLTIIISSLNLKIVPPWAISLLIVILLSLFFSIKKPRFMRDYFPVLLERAARPVNSTMDGFTDRPYPAGKFDYDEATVRGFANFTRMYLIATPFYESGRTIFVLSNGLFQYFKSIMPEFEKLTYVSFNPDGSYDVHISRKDYKRYKDQLTFDELCRSLGIVLLDIYSDFRVGQTEKILKDLKDDQHRLIYDV